MRFRPRRRSSSCTASRSCTTTCRRSTTTTSGEAGRASTSPSARPDALLAEALRLALSHQDAGVARELVGAVLGMIGGQARDVGGDNGDIAALHRLKTGRLFAASVGCALQVAGVPESEQGRWRD